MNVKIDTKEKFTTIMPLESKLTANMTENLQNMLLSYLQNDTPHIILNLNNIVDIDNEIAVALVQVQEEFYKKNCSFVICELQPAVSTKLKEWEKIELMNVTPTESEAWDILQMEEIERELGMDNGLVDN